MKKHLSTQKTVKPDINLSFIEWKIYVHQEVKKQFKVN